MSRSAPHHRRRVELRGAVNFRDLGGYATADGRRLKFGLLFRSDSLGELTQEDLAIVHDLQLRSICDLRHETERSHRPSRLRPDRSARTHVIGFLPHGAETLMDRVRSRTVSIDEAWQLMRDMYRRMPVDQAPFYAHLLDVLTQPEALPALVHCTSGKDRTGFGIAVLLLALGVGRETILEDYVLTNQYRRDLTFMLGSNVDPQVVEVVKRADPEFLCASFGVIDEVCGGEEAFLRSGLGLSVSKQRRLQDLMLEA